MSYDILFQQALNLHNDGRFDDAERIYRQILETAPNNPDLLNLLGLIAQAKNIHSEAVEFFYKAIQQSPNHAPLHFSLALSLNEWNKPYEAIDAYLKALALNPDIAEAYNNIGEIYKNLQNPEKAMEFYQKAIDKNEEFTDAKVNMAFISKDIELLKLLKTPLAFYYLSILAQELGNIDEALAYALQTEEYNQIAELYLTKGDVLRAKGFLKLALEVNPLSVAALVNFANIETTQNDIEAAEQKYKKALDINPNSFDAHLNYANLLYESNRPHEALEEYRKAVIINSDIPEVSNNIGIIQRDFAEYEQALDLFFNAFIKNPSKEEFAINISETLILMVHNEKKEQAIKIAEKWENLASNNAFAKHTLSALKGENSEYNQEYSKILFEYFANNYEETLKQIKYNLPNIIKMLVGNIEGRILDVGCGTGLLGNELKNDKNNIIGVDISSNMLAKAKDKNIYSKLVCSDIISYLDNNLDFDWIFAADVLGYIGDLDKFISLSQGKKLCFSIELSDKNEAFELCETGRYKHSRKYVVDLLEKYEFRNITEYETDLRLENGQPVKGMIFYNR